MCYDVRMASSSRPFVGPHQLFVANQVGTATLAGLRLTALCVPSVTP